MGTVEARRPEESSNPKHPPPPKTKKKMVREVLHGQRVDDPYRWLEEGSSPQVRQWVSRQNAYTRAWLDRLPERDKIERRLSELLSVGYIHAPVMRQSRLFYTRRAGLQNQGVLYWRAGPEAEEQVLIDPNRLSADGTTAMDWWYPAPDGRLLAYGLSQSGDEQSTLHIIHVDSGERHKDVIPRTRACSLAWTADGKGFFYTRYPWPGSVPESEAAYRRRIYFHALGNDPQNDPEIFGKDRKAEDWPEVALSPDGRYLLVTVFEGAGAARSDLYLKDLSSDHGFVALAEGENAAFTGEIRNDRVYIRTNQHAPNYQLYVVDTAQTDRARWRVLIPETPAVLEDFLVLHDRLLVHYLQNASSQLRVFSHEGRRLSDVPLPGIGSVTALRGEWNRDEAYFGFTSFTTVSRIYRLPEQTQKAELWAEIKTPVDTSGFKVQQIWYPSKDGALISMFMIHREGLVRDGNNPTLLTGYGGFNVSLTPTFSAIASLWLERGGIWVVANLRGGGEYGEPWHQAGMLGKKQNTFDDFAAAAEWLIAERYTKPARLAIYGGSNGGLLVGAALTQRPELFGAAICAVPLLDMLRYDRFLIAKLWIPEYGSAKEAESFRWLYGYSPYHRVKDGMAYPAVLFTTAESDARVDPLHARKMAARLQAATRARRPILLRVETKAGHGAGKPIRKLIAEQVDVLSFLFAQVSVMPQG
ncbi:MAG: S9 family peptidase [Acidobacteria bacterium]|nr:S9 family peptidase [Acidobacteriota bacterium]MBI3657316.1 S9 family peptidase [Acidobacteriota bacterium]